MDKAVLAVKLHALRQKLHALRVRHYKKLHALRESCTPSWRTARRG